MCDKIVSSKKSIPKLVVSLFSFGSFKLNNNKIILYSLGIIPRVTDTAKEKTKNFNIITKLSILVSVEFLIYLLMYLSVVWAVTGVFCSLNSYITYIHRGNIVRGTVSSLPSPTRGIHQTPADSEPFNPPQYTIYSIVFY